ncbi:MAG: hypothetical protein H0W72_06050 [Planctomycetes bacterium]|nr:hypothetical protein [Planctomycetota bacterium]
MALGRWLPPPLRAAAVIVAAIVCVSFAIAFFRSDDLPRPAREALEGSWIRSPDPIGETPAQPRPWPRIHEVASFDIGSPAPGQVTLVMNDGSTVHGTVLFADGGAMLLRVDDGAGTAMEATISRLGKGGPVVLVSGTVMITFLPTAG